MIRIAPCSTSDLGPGIRDRPDLLVSLRRELTWHFL
jgi:hypothetical protein